MSKARRFSRLAKRVCNTKSTGYEACTLSSTDAHTHGNPGLLGLHCSHRGADLSYGRLEDGGLRCLYHGWLYDVAGRCLEQPGEPAGSTFKDRVRQTAYPCRETAGVR